MTNHMSHPLASRPLPVVSSPSEEAPMDAEAQQVDIPVACSACGSVSALSKAIRCQGPESLSHDAPGFTIRRELYACSETCRPAVEIKVAS